MNQKKTQKALELIAQKENLTVEEVVNKIGLAVALALKSSAPELKYFWKQIPGKDEESPTIEEIIAYIAQHYAADQL